jgi:hypothetical protein
MASPNTASSGTSHQMVRVSPDSSSTSWMASGMPTINTDATGSVRTRTCPAVGTGTQSVCSADGSMALTLPAGRRGLAGAYEGNDDAVAGVPGCDHGGVGEVRAVPRGMLWFYAIFAVFMVIAEVSWAIGGDRRRLVQVVHVR